MALLMWSSPRWNGSTGSITSACSGLSAMSRQPKQKLTFMRQLPSLLKQHDSNPRVSEKIGAILSWLFLVCVVLAGFRLSSLQQAALKGLLLACCRCVNTRTSRTVQNFTGALVEAFACQFGC